MSSSGKWQLGKGYFSGLISGRNRRRGIRVFCYHGVVERKSDVLLERNLHLLSDFTDHTALFRRCRVLTSEELLHELSFPSVEKKPAAVITFDDGYANNLLAAEILSRYRMPWIVHISTGFVGQEKAIGAVELSLLLLHGEADSVHVLGKEWPLHNRAEREVAFEGIRVPMKAMPSAIRLKTMAEICSQFPTEETRRLLSVFPSLQMLSWAEIDQLSASGAVIGSHGVYHEIHHAHQDTEVRLSEMAHSKSELEKRLNRPCQCFAYPNGDTVPSSPVEARTAGYRLAFAAIEKTVLVGTDPYLIPRLKPRTRLVHMGEDLFW